MKNSIRKAVNILDKEMGIDIEHKKFYTDPDLGFQISCFKYQEYLAKIILELNEVEVPKGTDVIVFTKDMVRLSKLEWGKGRQYPINSSIYRRRFLTLFLTELSNHILDLCERKYYYESPGVGIYEHAYFYLLKIKDYVRRFVYLFMKPDGEWKNLMVEMIRYSFFINIGNYEKQVRLMENIKLIQEIRKGYYHKWFTKPYLDESLVINNIFKLTVLLCGGVLLMDTIPDFSSFENKKAGKDVYYNEIAFIGKVILKNKEHPKKFTKMYQIFEDASPIITTNMPKKDPYIEAGIRGLEFIKFIINDNCVTKLIDKITLKNLGWF